MKSIKNEKSARVVGIGTRSHLDMYMGSSQQKAKVNATSRLPTNLEQRQRSSLQDPYHVTIKTLGSKSHRSATKQIGQHDSARKASPSEDRLIAIYDQNTKQEEE